MKAPRIQLDVPGPGGEPGFLLITHRNEALEWDVQYEIASISRHWMSDRQAWWIASYYLHTAQEIVNRFAPPAPAARAAAPLQPAVGAAAGSWVRRLGAWLRLHGLRDEVVAWRKARLARRLESA